jgi:hypothetical protein
MHPPSRRGHGLFHCCECKRWARGERSPGEATLERRWPKTLKKRIFLMDLHQDSEYPVRPIVHIPATAIPMMAFGHIGFSGYRQIKYIEEKHIYIYFVLIFSPIQCEGRNDS